VGGEAEIDRNERLERKSKEREERERGNKDKREIKLREEWKKRLRERLKDTNTFTNTQYELMRLGATSKPGFHGPILT
jgi:hypothetical protein